MLKPIVCLAFLLLIIDVVLGVPDYKFNSDVNGWLKLHKVPMAWTDAFSTCLAEGAVLASPLTTPLANALGLIMQKSDVNRPIFLGVNSLWIDREFVSIEGVRLDEMPVTWGSYGDGRKPENCLTLSPDGKVYISSCTTYLPYICYKKRGKASHLNECGTFDNNYRYNETTGSCYKVHHEKRTWTEAYKTCASEGAYLVVLNDASEKNVVLALFPEPTSHKPKSKSQFSSGNSHLTSITHVGLHKLIKDSPWLTVTGDNVEDVYNKWNKDKLVYDGLSLCAGLTKHGTLNSYPFMHEASFVCEKDPTTSRFADVSDAEENTRL